MRLFKLRRLGLLLPLFVVTSALGGAQSDLKYEKRGTRYEGIREEAVAGYDIELLSAQVDYRETFNRLPDVLKVRFYLSEKAKTFLTVREINNRFFYWMDGVQSDRWQQGYNNFEWPTASVLRKLAGVDRRYPEGLTEMYALGVVARVGKDKPSIEEQVAPVFFYHQQLPSTVDGYLFTLKPAKFSRITCVVYKGNSEDAVNSENFPTVSGDTPFTFKVDALNMEAGWYRVVVNGIFTQTNNKFKKVISFYHHRSVS